MRLAWLFLAVVFAKDMRFEARGDACRICRDGSARGDTRPPVGRLKGLGFGPI